MRANQSGNFLTQALLAIALVVLFVPFLTRQMATREKDAAMYGFTTQISTIQNAARLYLRDNMAAQNYGVTQIGGNALVDLLEPYGMPLGASLRTIFGQTISMTTHKTDLGMVAYLQLAGGDLTDIRRAEQVRRLGFYASMAEDSVYLIIPLDEIYSDIVRRDAKTAETNTFLSDLDMGGYDIKNIGSIIARGTQFETAEIGTLSLIGIEQGRNIRNAIKKTSARKTIFQSADGEAALSVTRGTMTADSASLRTIAKFGDAGNFEADSASVFDLSMTAGRTSFNGPAKWSVEGDVISDNISFMTEVSEISSSINASRGQDVYITDTLEYSTQSGIDAEVIRTSFITMRDQTSAALLAGGTGDVILDIRPAGTSMLPDVLLDTVNNDAIAILSDPGDSGGDLTQCRSIISSLGGSYNSESLSQYIICQYVFWHRLEQRIDIKQCMLDGGSNCD